MGEIEFTPAGKGSDHPSEPFMNTPWSEPEREAEGTAETPAISCGPC